jgi:hypothetical protein
LLGLQDGVLVHCPPLLLTWQVCEKLHAVHVWPPAPHAYCSTPFMHIAVAGSQQPNGQLAGPQAELWHAPPTHDRPWDAQSMHFPPPNPHATGSEPDTHLPFWSQQPEQVAGPHLLASHDCEAMPHISPEASQFLQACPPLPQYAPSVPERQV